MGRPLSVTRKADRLAVAERIAQVASSHGAEAVIEEMGPRETWVSISDERGLRLTVDLDGSAPQPDMHLLSWNLAPGSRERFSDIFQSVNTCHRQKATDIVHGITSLVAIIDKRLGQSASGETFLDTRGSAA